MGQNAMSGSGCGRVSIGIWMMVYAVPPAYGRSESSGQAGEAFDRERVLECLQKAGLAEMTEKLPKGIDTNIGKDFEEDGIWISGSGV